MDQQETKLEVTEQLVGYFPNKKTRCFIPQCKPNKEMLEYLTIASLQPIDYQELTDCENDTRSKVSDPLDFPYSAIGWLSLKYGQKKFRGSGFLVGPNIVLTAARNLYIHQLQQECQQVKFYPAMHSLNGRECNVKKFHYPPQYKSSTPDERGEYNFAILELPEEVGLDYGHFGVDFRDKKQSWLSESAHVYEYPKCHYENKIQLDVRHRMDGQSWKSVQESQNRMKHIMPTSAGQCGSPIFIKETSDSYTVVGIHNSGDIASNSGLLLNNKMKAIINKWVKKIIKSLKLYKNDIKQENGEIKQQEFTKIIKKIQLKQINEVFLGKNNIGSEAARFLSQANWPSLTEINLAENNIGAEAAQFLSQANWPSLTEISLYGNNIDAEGAKFLSQANWPSLTYISLQYNNIDAEGAKFLSQANWPSLTYISLWKNNIGAEAAKFLSQANWPSLTEIRLGKNNIGAEAAKFLSQANWPSLTEIRLGKNNIGAEGAKFLSQANWPSLTSISLGKNNISAFGEQFLKSVQWSALPNFRICL